MDAMSRALRRAARSPFSRDIEQAPMPSRFTQPLFNSYDGKIDPVKHVSHYVQMMSLHTHNDALMCKVFHSSLGSTALKWFNGLRKGSIHSFSELIQEFGVRFMTCSRVPQPVDALLSMKMGTGETPAALTDVGNCTTRLAEVTKKSQQAPFDWDFPRIPNCESL